MRHSLILIGLFLVGLLLVGCALNGNAGASMQEAERQNPLSAEYIADQMIEYVTFMQIKAEENGWNIKDTKILRAIDEVFVEARVLQKQSHAMQDAGKSSMFYGVNNNYAFGEVLLTGEFLYTGYETEISAAPGINVYLAKHVSPHTSEDLFSEDTIDLGPLKSFRGAQAYHVGELSDDDWNEYRTVALYSKSLDRVIALAQIRGVVR